MCPVKPRPKGRGGCQCFALCNRRSYKIMKHYHKINTIFKRDLTLTRKPLIYGDWSEKEFEHLAHAQWEFTEKVDGTNIRIIKNKNPFKRNDAKITIKGKTDNAELSKKLEFNISKLFEDILDEYNKLFDDDSDVCFYGEGYGNKIQKNGYFYGLDQKFILFDININGYWLERHNVEDIAKKLNLDIVPIIGYGTLYDALSMVSLGGVPSTFGDFISEGLVAKPTTGLLNRKGERIITKIKTRDFN